MSQIVKIDQAPELSGVEQGKAKQIRNTFAPMVQMLEDFESQYNELINASQQGIDQALTAKAKRLRLDIAKVRVSADKARVEIKEEYLRAGKAIDGANNILKWAIKDRELKLKEIEDYFEIQEQKRLDVLQAERVELISPYVEDAHERDYTKFDADEFEVLLAAKKKAHEDELEAIRVAEQQRIAKEKAEAEERERMRKENERLQKEAEAARKKEAERIAKEKEEAKKRAEQEAKAKEEAEAQRKKEREAYDAKLRKEREERERIEKELADKAKAEAEAKAKAEADAKAKAEAEEAARQAELSKGDKEKFKDLIKSLSDIKIGFHFESEVYKAKYNTACSLVDKIINHINN